MDFGKAAFGQIACTLTSPHDGDSVVVHLGERIKDGRVDRQPAGTTRYRRIPLCVKKGTHTYRLKIRKDQRNTTGDAVLIPDYIGEVLPFRYAELEGYNGTLRTTDVVRTSVHHPFNELAASFTSSDTILNAVWNLCHYSMKATSFLGVYIDGDRERIPYEWDAYINQLGHYWTDRTYSMARHTNDYFVVHPTGPTEWILQLVLMARNAYLFAGTSC